MSKMIKKVFNGVIKEINIGEQTLTTIISTSAVDRMGEVLEPGGVDIKNFRKNPIVAWAHDYDMLPIGKALWTKKSKDGIISKMKFASHDFAQEVFNLYKDGFLHAFSVGFIPKEWEDGDGKKTPWRTYKKWEMLEYSAVPIPANPEALQLAVQKGIVHDDRLIDDIQKSMDEDEDEDETTEDTTEDKTEDTQSVDNKEDNEDKTDVKGLEDLLAENKLLAEEVNGLKNENTDLRYQLYSAMGDNEKRLSEIADDLTLDKVRATVDGAIRKATGKGD